MTDEFQIDGTTVAETDSNGDLVIKNLRQANFDGNIIIDSDGSGNVDLKNLSSVSTDKHSISERSVSLKKNTDQTVSQNTDTTIDWDSQTVDSIFGYDSSTDTVTLNEDGDYSVAVSVGVSGVSSGDRIFIKVFVNGARRINVSRKVNGDFIEYQYSREFKDLSANDTLRIDFRTGSTNGVTIDGETDASFAHISKEG